VCHDVTAFCPRFNLRALDNVKIFTFMMVFPRMAMAAQMARKFLSLMKPEV